MNKVVKGNLNGGVRYPVNNTAYSEENLCEELPICAEARDRDLHNFDGYCSGNHEGCSGKILTRGINL